MKSVLRLVVSASLGAAAITVAGAVPAPAAGPVGWTVQFGGSDEDGANAVAASSKNEVVVVGWTRGPGLVSSVSGMAGFVAKFDKDGTRTWLVQLGSSNTEFTAVAVAANGDIYAGGNSNVALADQTKTGGDGDAFVAKYDKNGNLKWLRYLASTGDDWVNGLAVKGSAVYVAGGTEGTLAGGPGTQGSNDGYLARFDTKGNRKFLAQFGTTETEEASSPSVSANGKTIVVAGSTDGTLADEDPATGRDAFVMAFNDKGVEQWHDQWGSWSVGDSAYAAAVGTNGLAYVVSSGDVSSIEHLQVHAYKVTTGALQASTDFDMGVATGSGSVAAITKKNELIVGACAAGALPGQTPVGDGDAAYIKFPKDLATPPTSRQFGTPDGDCGSWLSNPVAVMPNGKVVMAGVTRGSMFGFSNQGGGDVWVAVFPKP